MKLKFVSLLLFVVIASCAQEKSPLIGETEWQKKMNADFKDASKSPLKDKDRKAFKSLEFFSVDSAFVVKAHLTRTPDEVPFKMPTTTSRMPMYVKYGELNFSIKGEDYKLNIYQNLELLTEAGYEDYLFLPFMDKTNGKSTYAGGRYVESRIQEGDTLNIDFNTAYNPYCAYNEKYSCPIVPNENYIDVEVTAGVKVFKKH